ncbi:MAG: FAD-dependent oxidoreductase [Bulleidia sp.]|nr:FAD-dependent oxidoreductase [Bulleidia sp.]
MKKQLAVLLALSCLVGCNTNTASQQSISVEETSYETSADVIVVGAGAAGMTAAITAAENGTKVILLEKSNIVGGNTYCAVNGINAADSKVQLENAEYQANGTKEGLKELQMNNADAKEELVDAFVNHSGELIDWLSDMGVQFKVDVQNDQRNQSTNYYMLQAEGDEPTAVTMLATVSKQLEKTDGLTLYKNMDVYDLLTDDGNVNGVVAKDKDGSDVEFHASKVVLATGGFGQNHELVGKVNPGLANTITDEIAPTTGEGLLMAQKLGAATVNLDAIQTFPHVIAGYGLITPMNLPGGFVPDAIFVNSSAKRFTAETFMAVDDVLAQKDGVVYCIFTRKNLNDKLNSIVQAGFIKEGDTVEELAENLGLDKDALKETVDAFNQDIADGKDDEFGREENLNSIEGKLYGYRFGVGAHYFMGGILINANTEVLKEDGTVINGLYAAGEVTGGFHGIFRVDGSGVGDSFVFGRISGQEVSK